MCLYVSSRQSQTKFRKRIRENGGKITCWKVLVKSNNLLRGIFYYSYYYDGWNYSSRKFKKYGYNLVNEGIHVYTKREEAVLSAQIYSAIIVPVTCYLKDFVAYSKAYNEAVFLKVFLTKRSYNKAIK